MVDYFSDHADEKRSLPKVFGSVPTCLRQLFAKRWFVLVAWHLGSILLCGLNVFNALLASANGHTLPFLQLAATYTLVLLMHVWRYSKSDISWLKYIIVSIFSGAGDALAIYAYNTTSLSSAMLLSTTVVFWVAPLTFLVLGRARSVVQVSSIFVGFAGVAILCWADGFQDMHWLGNALALGAALAYAASNVLEELLVQTAPVTIFLCRLSMFLCPVDIAIGAIVEWQAIIEYDWRPKICIFVVAYAVLLAIYYSFIPFVLQFSSAMEMNISLLSSNFFSLAVSIAAFGQKADWRYLVGFCCVPLATALYTLFPPKEVAPSDPRSANGAGEAALLNGLGEVPQLPPDSAAAGR
jgi:drug/metabolite transporter (DMT)-like permease